MYTAQFSANGSRTFTCEFPSPADLYNTLHLFADGYAVYNVALTDPKGERVGQYRAGNGHRDFPQN